MNEQLTRLKKEKQDLQSGNGQQLEEGVKRKCEALKSAEADKDERKREKKRKWKKHSKISVKKLDSEVIEENQADVFHEEDGK